MDHLHEHESPLQILAEEGYGKRIDAMKPRAEKSSVSQPPREELNFRKVDSGLRFLSVLAEALHVYGTSADRLEEVLRLCAARLGLRAHFFAAPTSIQISIESKRGAEARMIRVDKGELNLDKLVGVDSVIRRLVRGEIGPDDAREQILDIRNSQDRFSNLARILSFAAAAALMSRLFGGGLREVVMTAFIALAAGCLASLLSSRDRFRPLAVVMTATLASALAFSFLPESQGPSAYLVTISSLILLMPGLKVTIAMRELAMQHLTAGTTRMMAAIGTLLALALGVAAGRRLGGLNDWSAWAMAEHGLPGWTLWLALGLLPLPLMVDYRVRLVDLPAVALGCFVAYFAARWGRIQTGPEVGAFIGAAAVGIASNLFSRLFDRPSSLMLIPGVTLLVPGSVGFRSVMALLDHDAISGIETGFTMILVGTALGSGLIFAHVLITPRRAL